MEANSATTVSQDNNHHLVFQPQGQMAASVSYIHVVLPVNISVLIERANPLFEQFTQMQQLKSGNLSHLPFCKNMADIGRVFELRLLGQLQILQDLVEVLPQDSPSQLTDVSKRVPWLLLLIPRLALIPYAVQTLAVLKTIGNLAIFSTIVGTSAHLISQSNKQELLNNIVMNESRIRDEEMDSLMAQYKLKLADTTQSYRPALELRANREALRSLNDTLATATSILPQQYVNHFNFEKIVPSPPPPGWEEYPKLIEAYTADLKKVDLEITDQIALLKQNPYIVKPAALRLTRQTSLTPLDEFRSLFLSLSSWDHQPVSFPSPSHGLNEEFVSQDSNSSRSARSFNWGALSTVVSGTFLGLYTSIELGQMRHHLNTYATSHNFLVQLSNRNDIQTRTLAKALAKVKDTIDLMLTYDTGTLYAHIDMILSRWERTIHNTVHTIQQAQHRRLSVDLLLPKQLELLHQSVLQAASRSNRQLLTHQPSDYFQLELSYARSGSDLLLILHVPTIATDDTLSIYQFLPFPFPLPKSAAQSQISIRHSLFPSQDSDGLPDLNPARAQFASSSQALYLDMDSDLLAINSAHQYIIISQTDLLSCLKRGHVYLCDKSNVLRTDLGETCLGALYFKSAEGVKAHCRFERRLLKEEVFQMTPTDFIVFSPTQFTTKIECTNGTLFPIFIGQVTKVTIQPGCHLTLNSHFVRPTEHFRLDANALVTEWTWDPLDLPSDLLTNGPHIDHYLKRLTHSLKKLKQDQAAELSQLRQEAAMDSEFEPLLIKQMKTFSIPAILFWFCFGISILGCLGSAIFYTYYQCTVRHYPSLVQALESMQLLLPEGEHHTTPESTISRSIARPRGNVC